MHVIALTDNKQNGKLSYYTFSSIIPALKLIKFTLQTSLATFAVTTQISKYSYQAKRGKISERNKQKKKGLL
jgi:hypothetical protein